MRVSGRDRKAGRVKPRLALFDTWKQNVVLKAIPSRAAWARSTSLVGDFRLWLNNSRPHSYMLDGSFNDHRGSSCITIIVATFAIWRPRPGLGGARHPMRTSVIVAQQFKELEGFNEVPQVPMEC